MSTINLVGHGFSAGDVVEFFGLVGGEGDGLTTYTVEEGTPYYVLAAGLTADTFAFSTTDGGAEFDFLTPITEGSVAPFRTYEVISSGAMTPPTTPVTPNAPTVTSVLVTDTEGHVLVHLKVTPHVPTDPNPGLRFKEIQISREAGPDWTDAQVHSIPWEQTTFTIPVLGSTTYFTRTRTVDVYGTPSGWSAVDTEVTTAGPDSVAVTNEGATVTIDDEGIHILDGYLSIEDRFGSVVLGASGFAGSWEAYVNTGFYNTDYENASATDIAVSEVSGADTTADYEASLTNDLPYWIVAESDGSLRQVADPYFPGGVALEAQSLAPGDVVRWYQDIPFQRLTETWSRLLYKFRAYGINYDYTQVRIFYSDRDSDHGLLGTREEATPTLTLHPSFYGFDVTGVAATNVVTTDLAHGFVAGDDIKFHTLVGGAGINTTGTTYYVKTTPTTTTFTFSATNGGAEFDFTTNITSGGVVRATDTSTTVSTQDDDILVGIDAETRYVRIEFEVTFFQSGQRVRFGRQMFQPSIRPYDVTATTASVESLFADEANASVQRVASVAYLTLANQVGYTLVVDDGTWHSTGTSVGDVNLHVGGDLHLGPDEDVDIRLRRSAAKTLLIDDGHAAAATLIDIDTVALDYGNALLRASGTSFPGSPTNNDRFHRSDWDMEFYYNGSIWLTTKLFHMPFEWAGAAGLSATATTGAIAAPIGPSDVYIENVVTQFFVASGGSALSGSHKWVGVTNKVVAANTNTAIDTCNIDSGSSNTWRTNNAAIGALLNNGTTHYALRTTFTKTGTPGNLTATGYLSYRLVAT